MSDSLQLRALLREAKANNKDYKWAKIANTSFEYEGQVRNNKPDGFGRIFWKSSGAHYHGLFRNHVLHGRGIYFHENGDRFDGNFSENKPSGEGISISGGKRLIAVYDGHKTFDEGAEPIILGEAPYEEITNEISFTVSAVSKGLDANNGKVQDFSHCKPTCARLAYAVPLRANKSLRNEDEIEGKIAIVMRGGCNFAAKVHHCQRAGAAGVLVLGTDDDDKYRHCFEVAEDDPDLAALPDAPSRIQVTLPDPTSRRHADWANNRANCARAARTRAMPHARAHLASRRRARGAPQARLP